MTKYSKKTMKAGVGDIELPRTEKHLSKKLKWAFCV
jgi:hypothetical protein